MHEHDENSGPSFGNDGGNYDLTHGNVNLNNSGAVLRQLRDPGFPPQVPSTSTTPGTSPDEFKPACKSWVHDATANSGFMSEVNFEAFVVHHVRRLSLARALGHLRWREEAALFNEQG